MVTLSRMEAPFALMNCFIVGPTVLGKQRWPKRNPLAIVYAASRHPKPGQLEVSSCYCFQATRHYFEVVEVMHLECLARKTAFLQKLAAGCQQTSQDRTSVSSPSKYLRGDREAPSRTVQAKYLRID